MKDYADQQRRLLQDISNLMLRNRDLLRQREEEERKRREQQKETEKQIDEAKKDENEAQLETEVPKVVALENVPQLIVPRDASKDGEEKQSEKVAEKNPVENEIILKEETALEAVTNDVEKINVKEIPESQANEISTDEDKETGDNLVGAARKGDQFRLDLPLTSKIMTLESPAFIPESALPVVVPPSEEEVAREAAEHSASLSAASPEYNPLTFPPSPMVGTAKPIATLTPDAQTQETKKLSPNASPNTRRKFVISRVQESASPVTKSDPRAKHSTETLSASGDSSSLQPSSFQSPGNGNHGSCSGGDDRTKEPVSLPDNSNKNKSSKDLNENPTERTRTATNSVITATSEDAPETHSSDDTTNTSNIGNSAKSDTIKSNEPSENKTTDENTTTPTDNSDSNDTNHNMTVEAQKLPDFHTNMSLNGMKVELANVIDSLDKSGKTSSSTQGGSREASNSPGDSGMISSNIFNRVCDSVHRGDGVHLGPDQLLETSVHEPDPRTLAHQ